VYRLTGQVKATVRAEFPYDSEPLGEIRQGEAVAVVERRTNGRGTVRLRFAPDAALTDARAAEGGWVSEAAFPSRQLLFELVPDRGARRVLNGEYQFRVENAWETRFAEQAKQVAARPGSA
jgi:hypothetical protein